MGPKRRLANMFLLAAALLMLLALICDSITIANGEYRNVLRVALACMTIADVICIYQVVVRRGLARWIAPLIALPSFFIVSDVARRAPHVRHLSR